MIQLITVLRKYFVKNRISEVNFSDLHWRSNDLRSQFCHFLLQEILGMNHHANFQDPKWSLCAIAQTYKITWFFTTICILEFKTSNILATLYQSSWYLSIHINIGKNGNIFKTTNKIINTVCNRITISIVFTNKMVWVDSTCSVY